jgi:hypothetical protein
MQLVQVPRQHRRQLEDVLQPTHSNSNSKATTSAKQRWYTTTFLFQ